MTIPTGGCLRSASPAQPGGSGVVCFLTRGSLKVKRPHLPHPMLRGEDGDNSHPVPYDPPAGWTVSVFKHAPRHKRSAALLRMVGQTKKAEAEENCGVSLKGKCPKPLHGIVREGRSSGKTPWCAGCNTETSAKYLNMTFPVALYTILRLQSHVEIPSYGAAELEPGSWGMSPDDSAMIAGLVTSSRLPRPTSAASSAASQRSAWHGILRWRSSRTGFRWNFRCWCATARTFCEC